MRCCICEREESQIGTLCGRCRDALVGPIPITREQIRPAKGALADGALIDVWGWPHRLCSETTIGRAPDHALFSVYDSSVSRIHARVALADGAWTLTDLGSANGTFVDDKPATTALPLKSGSRVRIGFINFYFVANATSLALPPRPEEFGQTVRPGPLLAPGQITRVIEVVAPLPEVMFKLSEPSGGGGGVVEIGGKPVHLTLAQYDLVSRLVARMLQGKDEPTEVRGFISSDELAGVLALDSQRPDDDNVRQLVRRVRRLLEKAGVADVIESRYGLGYRLSVTPRVL